MTRPKQLFAYACLIVLPIGFWLGLWMSGLLLGLEQEALRWRYLVRGERSTDAPIVFVDLDWDAISKIGDKPWDRLNFAQVLQALLGPGQAKTVGVDIIFSSFGKGSLLDVNKARKGDHRLGQVVEAYSDQVVLAAAYTRTTPWVAPLPLARHGFDDPRENPFPEAPSYPIIQYDAGRLGLANVDEELSAGTIPRVVMAFAETEGEQFSRHLMGGKMRYFSTLLTDARVKETEDAFRLVDSDGFGPPPIPRFSEQRLLTLGLAMFLSAHGLDSSAVEHGADWLTILKDGKVFRKIPLLGGQSIEVNWLEAWFTELGTPHVSLGEVLVRAHALGRAAVDKDAETIAEQEAWFSQFKDKVVFVGPVDTTLKDIAPTPFDRVAVPKVGLHANLFRTIEEEAYIMRANTPLTVTLVIGLTILVALLALWSGAGRTLTRIGSVAVVLGYLGMIYYCFAAFNFILPMIAPLGSALTASLLVVLVKLGSEEWQRRRIKAIFGAYVSPELVDEMVDSNRDPELGGTEAEITALFSDVEGFSALSELLPPDRLVPLMNEYLGGMTDALQAQGGTLDKYIGDAIVTMFGMPLPIKDHAAKACLAAVRMQERHAELRAHWAQSGEWPPAVAEMRTRIGLNTGVAVIGNMGSKVRFNYTMMGDSVNLAARCESGAKTYGIYTMVTAPTYHAAIEAGAELQARMLDRIIVKGRSEPVEVYELWDGTADPELVAACKRLYEEGLELYFGGNWQAALEKFQKAEAHEPAKAHSHTTPSKLLAKRCSEFIERGGPDDWCGAYRMLTK